MTRKSLFSTLGVLVAAVASVATSAPEPDWTLDDAVEGDLTLTPDQEEAVVKLNATSEVVGSSLGFDVRLDPAPARRSSADLADTPIVLFVSAPAETGKPPAYLAAIPGAPAASGYEAGSAAGVSPREGARELEVHITWKSPDPSDYQTSKCSGSPCQYVTVTRPQAARETVKIHWRAAIHADGYDDRPRGAKVDVEVVP